MTHGQLGMDKLAADGHLKRRCAASSASYFDSVAEDLERLRQCDGGWSVASSAAVLNSDWQ